MQWWLWWQRSYLQLSRVVVWKLSTLHLQYDLIQSPIQSPLFYVHNKDESSLYTRSTSSIATKVSSIIRVFLCHCEYSKLHTIIISKGYLLWQDFIQQVKKPITQQVTAMIAPTSAVMATFWEKLETKMYNEISYTISNSCSHLLQDGCVRGDKICRS